MHSVNPLPFPHVLSHTFAAGNGDGMRFVGEGERFMCVCKARAVWEYAPQENYAFFLVYACVQGLCNAHNLRIHCPM